MLDDLVYVRMNSLMMKKRGELEQKNMLPINLDNISVNDFEKSIEDVDKELKRLLDDVDDSIAEDLLFGASASFTESETQPPDFYVETLNLDTMFTPQVVVQGRAQCLGTDQDALLSHISSAPRFPSPSFQAKFERPSPETLQVTLTGAVRTKIDSEGADILVALYENGLLTDCPAGDNRGRVLSNDFVVRKMEKLCNIKDISAKKTVNGTVSFSLWDGFKSNKCGIGVFLQDRSFHTFGCQNLSLPQNL
ncbi:uncharacterized protein LOC122092121 [Macadamia integrifolia]|uniref:uncharacterized protein LOC122092121 n=1 Tax=Macadamia integrifolia TaxID=60698 RepID=UPI001C4EFBDA|nr:uncharacterized protein LOC122092121 [Macadamia integrifolia]